MSPHDHSPDGASSFSARRVITLAASIIVALGSGTVYAFSGEHDAKRSAPSTAGRSDL